MKILSSINVISVCATATLLLAGCAAKRVATHDVQRDSVVVREVVEYVVDTVEVSIPLISETVATRDTISHLENAFAFSDAMVSGGLLHHSLSTKPQLREVQIKTPRLRRDSIVYRYANREVGVTVEKQLTFAQKIQLNGFWFMLLAVVILSLMLWMRGRE